MASAFARSLAFLRSAAFEFREFGPRLEKPLNQFTQRIVVPPIEGNQAALKFGFLVAERFEAQFQGFELETQAWGVGVARRNQSSCLSEVCIYFLERISELALIKGSDNPGQLEGVGDRAQLTYLDRDIVLLAEQNQISDHL